ncbi:TetR/AcrR family transcriptional regulator [Nocardia australiensis]|uniref:TetR/AcrR family transcriptional regulator n=1 Tax=Nocardia australiensis TaxID=2887191 RepID=UPI001D1489A3|nr:TetR/AcrR family transcriptional regulator C-terminal domain-containing protein [Nocardia australiensis]
MPRPRSLTPTAIATAALAVIDRDGLSALTMRAVAKELHMATMSLYRYVSTRDELELLVVDLVLADIDISLPPSKDWRTRVTILLDRMRAAISAHSAVVPLVPRHRKSSPATLRWMNTMLSVLADAGFAGRDQVIAQRTVVAYLLGFLENEHYASISGAATAAIAQLPTTDYPFLIQTAALAHTMSADDEFRGGVEIVLRGLQP